MTGTTVIVHRVIGAPVDCHVLHFGEPAAWLDQCLAALEDEACNVVIVRGGFPGNIGAARAFAFSLGRAPYLSFCDADDYLLPGAVAPCTAAMDDDPALAGVYTDYLSITPDGKSRVYQTNKGPWSPLCHLRSCWEVLHYHQYRRSAVVPYLDTIARFPCYEELVIAGMAARHGDFIKQNRLGYVKREAGQSMRLASAALLRDASRTIAPALLVAVRRWAEKKRAA